MIKNYDVEPDNFIVSFIHKSLLESPDIFLVEIKIVLTSIVFSSIFFGLTIGIFGGLISSFRGKDIENKSNPNQAIFQSLVNSIVIGLTFFIYFEFFMFFVMSFILKPYHDPIAFIYGGMFFGGGMACIQHFILRIFLYRQNFIPWNYAQFLDYAYECNFLQKVGGGYIFIHRMLMEHFAKIDTKLMR